MVQDMPLARALHASCELGQEVPAQLFTAVARVLAFVMHLGAKGVKGGFHRPGFEAPWTEGLPKAGRRRAAAAAWVSAFAFTTVRDGRSRQVPPCSRAADE